MNGKKDQVVAVALTLNSEKVTYTCVDSWAQYVAKQTSCDAAAANACTVKDTWCVRSTAGNMKPLAKSFDQCAPKTLCATSTTQAVIGLAAKLDHTCPVLAAAVLKK